MDGADTLTGGHGNDRLAGGLGYDKFVFATGDGRDTITDFTSGFDTIDLSDVSGIVSFSDLKKHHLTVSGSDLVIADGAFKLILTGTEKADLHFYDFSF
jgi:Ca2+-binding RTX toxin-like protein